MFRRLASIVLLVFALALWLAPHRLAESAESAAPSGAAAAKSSPSRTRSREPRKLAPGVLTVIQPVRQEAESFSGPRELVEIVHGPFKDWKPTHAPKSLTIKDIAKTVTFRRKVWCLEFAFKPVRMIEVDIPQTTGKMQRKLIWYIVYRLRNTGLHLDPAAKADAFGHKTYGTAKENYSIRFFPHFVMECHQEKKAYLDRVIPLAVKAIQAREDPNTRLFNSVQISQVPVQVSTDRVDRSVWGVATWESIDRGTDYFSIYVQGLTNAYRWEDPKGAYKEGDPPGTGRRYQHKNLQLNFWRPGDRINEHEGEIRFGIPGKVDYRWLYR